MDNFSQIEKDYTANRTDKSQREAYKIVLLSRISQDRSNLCQSYSDFKGNLSPSKIWQNFIPNNTNSFISNKFVDLLKSYPYLSLYAGKQILKLGKLGSKSKLVQVALIVTAAKLLAYKLRDKQADKDDQPDLFDQNNYQP